MSEPLCGFGGDNKYCSALWTEHSRIDTISTTLKAKVLEAISTFEASISTAIEDDAIQRLSRRIEDIFDEEDDDEPNRTILDAPYNDIEIRIAQFLDGPIIQLFGGQEDGKGQ
jgi:hypothetical protein